MMVAALMHMGSLFITTFWPLRRQVFIEDLNRSIFAYGYFWSFYVANSMPLNFYEWVHDSIPNGFCSSEVRVILRR